MPPLGLYTQGAGRYEKINRLIDGTQSHFDPDHE